MKIKIFFCLAITLLAIISSGCLGNEKPSDPEELYWWHLDEASHLADEANEIWKKVIETNNSEEGWFLISQIIENNKISHNHALTALNTTNDPQKMEYARLRAEAEKYFVLAMEEFAEAGREDNMDVALEHFQRHQDYLKKSNEYISQFKEIRPKRGLL